MISSATEPAITREAVALSYIQDECSKLFSVPAIAFENLASKDLFRLLEAISYTYRMNGVFAAVTDQGYDWYRASTPISAITLNGIKPRIDEIVRSSEINNNPMLFAEYLQRYFAAHPNDDPEGLDEFRPRAVGDDRRILMACEKEGCLKILDGAHRLMSLAMSGETAVTMYIGRHNGQPHRSMLGDSVFLTLKKAYEAADSEDERAAVLQTVKLLMQASADGREAVQLYWVDHIDPSHPDMPAIGKRILAG